MSFRVLVGIVFVLSMSAAACGVSPAAPTEDDRAPRLTVSPSEPIRSGDAILYTAFMSLSMTAVGSTVTVRQMLFTVIGPDGSVYGTGAREMNDTLSPNISYGGAGPSFLDRNLAHQPATKYTLRVSYIRQDGSPGFVEKSSTFTAVRTF